MTERKRRMWKWKRIKRRINKCGVKQAKEWLPILFRWLWWKVYLTLKDRMWSKIRNAPIPNKKGEQIRNEKQTKFARGSRQHENNLQQQCPFPTSNCDNNHQIIMLIIKFLIVIILVTELLDNISHIRDISKLWLGHHCIFYDRFWYNNKKNPCQKPSLQFLESFIAAVT